jgi:protein-S-isoprenylcysteine O-methyltransferase Ste14
MPAHPTPGGRSAIMTVAVGLFAVGLVAVVAILALFAFGRDNLPWWLSVWAVVLTSAGFGLGLIALLREARSPG